MPAVLLLVAIGYLLLYAFAAPFGSMSMSMSMSTSMAAPLPDSSWMMNMQSIEALFFENTARYAVAEYMHHVSAG